MRIDLNTNLNIPKNLSVKKGLQKLDFKEHIESASYTLIRQQLDEELDKINKQGKILCDSMSMGDFVKYKKMVKNFLRQCVSGGLSYKEHMLKSRFGRSKILSIVEKVNKKLIKLLDEFLLNNKDPLKIISLVDEIKGLLLDLYT